MGRPSLSILQLGLMSSWRLLSPWEIHQTTSSGCSQDDLRAMALIPTNRELLYFPSFQDPLELAWFECHSCWCTQALEVPQHPLTVDGRPCYYFHIIYEVLFLYNLRLNALWVWSGSQIQLGGFNDHSCHFCRTFYMKNKCDVQLPNHVCWKSSSKFTSNHIQMLFA